MDDPFRQQSLMKKEESTQRAQRDSNKKCLILDLDETLVYRVREESTTTTFSIYIPAYGTMVTRYITVRPGVTEFLDAVAPHFDVYIFTAGFQPYADSVLDRIDTNGVIKERLYNDSCLPNKGNNRFQKDPTKISTDLSKTIVVDDDPDTFLHKSNGIEVTDFDCKTVIEKDHELWYLSEFLLSIKDVQDVRTECPKWPKWRQELILQTQERSDKDGTTTTSEAKIMPKEKVATDTEE